MDVFIMAAQLMTGLCILVFIHEMGHFLAAKAFGIKVDKFYVFFDAWGKKLISFKHGETEYGIGWLPLGGYVKIAGMIDESMDKEQMAQPPKPWEFRSKPAWQRFIVMVGGIVMNIILGIIIYSLSLLAFKEQYLPAKDMKYGIVAYDLARDIGLRTGDQILAINGDEIKRFSEVISAKMLLADNVTVMREGKIKVIDLPEGFFKKFAAAGKDRFVAKENFPFLIDSVVAETPADSAGLRSGDRIISLNGQPTPRFGELRDALAEHRGSFVELEVQREGQILGLKTRVSNEAKLGFLPSFEDDYQYLDYTFFNCFAFGYKDAFQDLLYQSIIPFGKMFKGEINASESVQGPLRIATIYGSEWIWQRFWYFTGLISMVLAFMNFLPIPALDGGHVMFILIEMVSRRKLSDKFVEKAQIVGLIILFSLMILILGNDIVQLAK